MKTIKFSKTKNVKTPSYGTTQSNGLDFFIPQTNENQFIIQPHTSINIPSGIKVELPEHYALVAFNKSGIALNKHLQVGACVIDSDYRGEIHLHVYNTSNENIIIESNQKLVQFLFIEAPQVLLEEVEYITSNTTRGDKGFGSTGLM